jgi:hypothetical protein
MKTKYRAVKQNEKILKTDEVRLKNRSIYTDDWDPVSDPRYKEYAGTYPGDITGVQFRRKVAAKPPVVETPKPVEVTRLKVGLAVFIEAKFHVGKGIVLEDDGTSAYPFKVRRIS